MQQLFCTSTIISIVMVVATVLEWIALAGTPSANMQGIAPFGEDIALLAYVLGEGSSLREAQAPGNGQAGDARRPEVRP